MEVDKKNRFFGKWSNFWILHKDVKTLDIAFKRELDEVIEHHNKITEKEINEAIKGTLVISNPQSIKIAIDKIMMILKK